MTRAIDFYFDFVSPYSYLAITQLPALARQHGADLGRWAAKYGVSLHRNPHQSKFDSALLLRGALCLRRVRCGLER